MKYHTLFIEHGDAEALTRHVNDLEREGWEFVGVQLACVSQPVLPNRGLEGDAQPRGKPKLLAKMLATLRREADTEVTEQTVRQTRPAPAPWEEPGVDE